MPTSMRHADMTHTHPTPKQCIMALRLLFSSISNFFFLCGSLRETNSGLMRTSNRVRYDSSAQIILPLIFQCLTVRLVLIMPVNHKAFHPESSDRLPISLH
mmetsp:Transcript_45558/g.76070  ORF Transcript_45558/g.76070 Transcript_45558/m.76070 type:complete len:101 (-) Transcript_45558:469-771(-)